VRGIINTILPWKASRTLANSSTTNNDNAYRRENNLTPTPNVDKGNPDELLLSLDDVLSDLRIVVSSFVRYQTASWFRYLKAYRVAEERSTSPTTKASSSAVGVNDNSYKGRGWEDSTTVKHYHRSSVSRRRENEQTVNGRPGNVSISVDVQDEIIWDDESDIPSYFKMLEQNCVYDERATRNLEESCLKFLYNLVHLPRCTVRYDSRTSCRRADKSHSQVPIQSILGPEHFSNDTINVVIIGAGPVGLYLANALIGINEQESKWRRKNRQNQSLKQHPPSFKPKPRFRIVVFENRVFSDGHKRPYSRTWMTALSYKLLSGSVIDHRIKSILSVIFTERRERFWPINFYETILLLSNRDRGVKFLYAEDGIKDYENFLVAVPNLVMFDATGHRLSKIDRSERNDNEDGGDDGTVETQITSWEARGSVMAENAVYRWGFPREWLEPRPGSNESTPLKIAVRKSPEAGTLLYPVLEDGSNRAYYMHRFDLCNMPPDDEVLEQLDAIVRDVDAEFKWQHGVKPPYQGGRAVLYDDTRYHRADILSVLDRSDAKFLGWDFRGFSFKLTPEQGLFLEEVVARHSGEEGKSGNIPLTSVAPEEITNQSVLDTNRVGEALNIVIKLSHKFPPSPENPHVWINAYRSRPHMYADPVFPGGYSLSGGKRRVPILRVGDSLLSGDTDIASGLATQLNIVRQFQCRLLTKLRHPLERSTAEDLRVDYPLFDACDKI